MKKWLSLFVVVVLTAAITLVLKDIFSEESALPEEFIQAKLFSRILNQEREIIVHLPTNYDSVKRYPVIYVLDGGSEVGHVAEKFDVLISAGYAPPIIVVGIPNMSAENRERNLTPPFMRTDVEDLKSPPGEGDRFLSFMESELFPFMEKNYGASSVRLFHGHSRGGLLVMYSLLYKAEMFNARFCYSAPFWRQENIVVSKVSELITNRDSLNTFLFMSAGVNETDNIKGGLTKMSELLQKEAPKDFVWHTHFTPNADHQTNSKRSSSIAIGKWCEYYRVNTDEK